MSVVSGGDKLTKVLAEIGEKMDTSVKVGFMEGSTYPDGTNVATVAFWNEFGTRTAPPRPFFRTMISQESPSWPKLIAAASKNYDYNGNMVMKFMGEQIKEQLQQSINGWTTPANAPYTIAKKGFNAPLRDTMNMRDSIDYEVGND
jgi:hypothetical protein